MTLQIYTCYRPGSLEKLLISKPRTNPTQHTNRPTNQPPSAFRKWKVTSFISRDWRKAKQNFFCQHSPLCSLSNFNSDSNFTGMNQHADWASPPNTTDWNTWLSPKLTQHCYLYLLRCVEVRHTGLVFLFFLQSAWRPCLPEYCYSDHGNKHYCINEQALKGEGEKGRKKGRDERKQGKRELNDLKTYLAHTKRGYSLGQAWQAHLFSYSRSLSSQPTMDYYLLLFALWTWSCARRRSLSLTLPLFDGIIQNHNRWTWFDGKTRYFQCANGLHSLLLRRLRIPVGLFMRERL